MESEKVKEIKNNLNTEIKLAELNKTRFTELVSVDLIKDILTLINELESENERLSKEKEDLRLFDIALGNGKVDMTLGGITPKDIDETLKEFINE